MQITANYSIIWSVQQTKLLLSKAWSTKEPQKPDTPATAVHFLHASDPEASNRWILLSAFLPSPKSGSQFNIEHVSKDCTTKA